MKGRNLLAGYFAVTAGLWLIVFFTERCWMWENQHQLPDIGRRDGCLTTWGWSSIALVLCQLACLAVLPFASRLKLSMRSRAIVAICAIVVLVTSSLVQIFLLMPRIH